MSYDEELAKRVRRALDGQGMVEERRMFGGLTFMLDGKMCCGVHMGRLMVRVPPERQLDLLKRPHAKPMDFTGRPMKGFLFIDAAGVSDAKSLNSWLKQAVTFVQTKSKPRRA